MPVSTGTGRGSGRIPVVARLTEGKQHVVVAGILVRDGKVLLCRRSAERDWYPGVWDLPGGHIETHESAAQALIRELHEELGVSVAEPLGDRLARIVTDTFDMQVWKLETWSGDPTNLLFEEHDEVGWFTWEEAAALPLADDSYGDLLAQATDDIG